MSDAKRPVFVLVAAALAAAAAAWFAKDALIQPAVPAPGASFSSSAVGAKRTAPSGPLFVTSRDGGRRDLSSKTGKGLILHFWATWCAPCREEMPGLVTFFRDMKKDANAEFLAISVDDDWKIVDAWLGRNGISGLPLALDPKGMIAGRYGATGYPETFFIAPSGEIVQHFVGAADWGRPEVRAFVAEFSRPAG